MRFAKRVFTVSGLYGLAVLVPMYFLETRLGVDMPPPINHPEYYYGFAGTAVAWQVAFLIIGRDPLRYRLLMLPAIIEKVTYGGAVLVLFAQGRVPGAILASALIDLVWAVLFAAAYRRTGTTSLAAPEH